MDRKTHVNTYTVEEGDLVKFAEQVFPTAEILQLNTAGEPLMSRHFDLELELAERYYVKLDVITNGVLLNSKKGRLQRLCRAAKAIQFSFDSPVKRTYESIRVGAEFDQVVENMRLFQRYRNELPLRDRPFFGMTMVLMKRNLGELLDLVRFAKDIGVDHLGVARVHTHRKEMEGESLENCKQEVNHTLLAAQSLATHLGISITIPPLFDGVSEVDFKESDQRRGRNPISNKELKRCLFLWKRVYLTEEANILVCCEPSHRIAGSLRENCFKDIWNGEIYLRMRRTFTGGPPYGPCYECAKNGYFAGLSPF
jgi:MoaA/NifB/PqqE/SkfB family radical SAM enzyme